MASPVAGPSTRPFFAPSFRLDEYAQSVEPPSIDSRASSPAAPPRAGSRPPSRSHSRPPSRPPSRARSNSVFSNVNEKRYDERIRKKRYESVQRLKSAWELLLEKYGHVRPEDDDEIDLVTGTVVKNRGRLQDLVPREFGQVSDGEEEEEEDDSVFGQETVYDTDEDELGQWDDRSGLDNQDEDEEEPPPPPPKRWTFEDQLDLEAFLKLEGRRKDDEGDEPLDDDVPLRAPRRSVSKGRGEVGDVPRLGAGDSDDELLAQTSDAEEATRIEFIPSDGEGGENRGRQRNRLLAERERRPPPDPNSLLGASLPPNRSPNSTPRAEQLFTPPPDLAPIPRAAAVPIVRPIPQRSAFVFQERIFTSAPKPPKPKKTNVRDKTNEQPNEVPPPGLDPAVYYQNTMRSRNGVSLRFCKGCTAAGGERAQLAIWCKGRTSVMHCTFEPPLPSDDEDSVVEDNGVFSGAFRSSFKKKNDRRAARSCKRCRRAGGIRADRSVFCKGRKSRALCPYDSDDTDVDLPRIPSPPRKAPIVPTAPLPDVDPTELDPDRYFLDVHYTHGGARIRACAACRYTGGERERRAAYCKGRWRVALCTFGADEQGPDAENAKVVGGASITERSGDAFEHEVASYIQNAADSEDINDPLDRLGSEELITSITSHVLGANGDFTEMSERAAIRSLQSSAESSAPFSLDPERYHDTLSTSAFDPNAVRRCKHCREAGGERERLSQWCKGRTRVKMCSWYVEGDDGDWTPAKEADKRAEHEAQIMIARPSTPPRPAKTLVKGLPPLEDGYYFDVRYSRNGKSLVRCQACVANGGVREEKAKWCKGRRHPGLCAYAQWDREQLKESADTREPLRVTDEQQSKLITPTRVSVRKDDEDEEMVFVKSGGSSKRRRVMSTTPVDGNSAGSPISAHRPVVPGVLALSEATTSEVVEVVDEVVEARTIDANGEIDAHEGMTNGDEPRLHDPTRESRSVSSSLPPSSPPSSMQPLHVVHHASRSTPSPDVHAPHGDRFDSSTRFLASTSAESPSFAVPTLNSTAAFTFHPTPPPSIGARSSSFSSEAGPASFPRRGILRRPSEFDRPGSLPRLSKRARFSLAPLSPPRVAHSDPILPFLEMEDDELLLGPSTSPAYPTRVHDASFALPFSREISLRAKDVGFNLSAHTGRLSSDMLAALAPALNHQRTSTLGSSLRHSVFARREMSKVGTYSLPTPPPSLGPSASTSRPRPTPLSQEIVSMTDALPSNTSAFAIRLPTPVSAEGEGDSDGDTITPVNRSKRRARSVSILRSETKRTENPPVIKHPASTPHKKTRLEENLEDIAMLVEDEGLEWGMDEDVGEDLSKLGREGSVVCYVE